MEFKEIIDKSDKELDLLEGKLRKELAELWIQARAGTLANVSKIGHLRRDIARVLTKRNSKIAAPVAKKEVEKKEIVKKIVAKKKENKKQESQKSERRGHAGR
jgi:ribosomal protein L29